MAAFLTNIQQIMAKSVDSARSDLPLQMKPQMIIQEEQEQPNFNPKVEMPEMIPDEDLRPAETIADSLEDKKPQNPLKPQDESNCQPLELSQANYNNQTADT